MSKAPARLGRVQQQIMEVLWREGRATARQITEELSRTRGSRDLAPEAPAAGAGSRAIAHSTVQTLLRKLEAKGVVTHDVEERTFVFRPVYQSGDITTSATRELLSRAFQGSVYRLVAHLLQHETISPEERERLRQLIEEEGKP